MFGYFRFNQLYASPKLKNVYKNYYCGACFSLEYNYGELARCILSYDVVILALIAKLHDSPNQNIPPCFFDKPRKVQFQKKDGWQKVSAINILLMNAKFDDDINDERSLKARLAASIFSPSIRKAKKSYPRLAQIINDGYSNMFELEKKHANILDICNEFAEMMALLLSTAFDIDSNKITYVKGIARWLYFIDQLEDYDDDIKEGKYNPLVIDGLTKTEMINSQKSKIFFTLKEIFKDYEEIKNNLDLTSCEDCLLYAVLNESIPHVTSLILSEKKLPRLLHRKKQLEWEEVK